MHLLVKFTKKVRAKKKKKRDEESNCRRQIDSHRNTLVDYASEVAREPGWLLRMSNVLSFRIVSLIPLIFILSAVLPLGEIIELAALVM